MDVAEDEFWGNAREGRKWQQLCTEFNSASIPQVHICQDVHARGVGEITLAYARVRHRTLTTAKMHANHHVRQ